ncbi:MAG TPA: biopolymer transporter ExbD [Steroidobacteraceae bacterium]|nr:biopolymer transporter ExbD [Steroidobacteraceae bacterium]
MYSNRQARKRLIRRLRGTGGELNLVPMIDIFTVLVTFLLMTAVFYRTVILELNLPAGQNADNNPPPALQLEILVRKAKVQVADRGSGLLSEFPNRAEGYDLVALSEYLQRVKDRFPNKLDATILLEPDIPYDTLVQVMDTVRVVEQVQGARTVQAELFPEISIGDAPL